MTTTSEAPFDDASAAGSLLNLGPIRRAPRIKREDVFREADALLVAGQRPTIDRVRIKLGRGSPNTINEYLDAWWAKLGSRLRDLPDRQFPALPERVATTLQQLWNEALDGAQDALAGTQTQRQQALDEREVALAVREHQLQEQERALAGRSKALEDAFDLTKGQLLEANLRAATLEESLRARAVDVSQLKNRIETVERENSQIVSRHAAERERLEERHGKAEARWLAEVDRARQALKDLEKGVKELRAKLAELRTERDSAKQEMIKLNANLTTAIEVRTQLEERIRLLSSSAIRREPSTRTRKMPVRRKPRPGTRVKS